MDLGIESLAALIGAIMVGICYAKANQDTKWFSDLGIITIMGLILMVVGFASTIISIKGG